MWIRATMFLLALSAATLVPRPATAFDFWPSEMEWAWWPDYCRARYVTIPSGAAATSKYRSTVPQATINEWKGRLGDAWLPIHHHCAGTIWLQRAKLESNEQQRSHMLRTALAESQFTLERIPPNHPMHAEVLTHMGLVEREAGHYESAIGYFDQSMALHPTLGGAYQGKALLFRDQKLLRNALEVLEAGSEATGRQSAEIEYFLGLLLLEMNRPEQAREHASRAYELGYPLPALRNKLERAGYPLP